MPAWSRRIGRFLAHGVWDTEVIGSDHVPVAGPVILAANHTGVVDGPLVVGVAPRGVHMMVKEAAFVWPVGVVLRVSGHIPVDGTGGRPALVAASAVLRRGDVVGIFPEGNRGRGDAARAHAGVAWLAVNSGAPVVPVAVLGTRRTGEEWGTSPGCDAGSWSSSARRCTWSAAAACPGARPSSTRTRRSAPRCRHWWPTRPSGPACCCRPTTRSVRRRRRGAAGRDARSGA
ncbi:lysophospholipid acyltransferase family protein [Cellulomonas sp. ATA003]|uniref:lysophospholipid acyltransferase family protein n=1 Tax=Cellulomonas sp. ATA003 TaxID=3073064 RepID=UPI0028733551|nr:lysophospholipid acyltransferase family protein [Cellulomonas sp. ATA003]WNB87054.1 lysophospholipid acyltransferase family protein [Cellulomonas sp. ATA003]